MHRFVSFDPHDAQIGSLAGELAFENFRHQLAGSDLKTVNLHLLAGEEPQGLQLTKQVVVAGVAKSFFEALSDAALKSFRQRGGSPGGVKRNQGSEAVHAEFFRLGEWCDGRELAFAQDAGWLGVLVNQSLDRKNELVMKGRDRALGQAANIEFQGVGAATQAF